jgi:hypothetical protein
MDMPHVRATVRRITVFDRDSMGSLRPVVIYNRRRGKKKQTKGLRPLERMVRTFADANDAFASNYARRHRRSNRKRRDGWLRDALVNWSKATNKGAKEFRSSRVLSW